MLSLVFASLWAAPAVLAATAEQWRSRSIYQIITDRFALSPGQAVPTCDVANATWCGGTWNSIRENLDYVQNAGFTAIWISPVSQNWQGPRTPYGDAYHGYWIADISQLNDKFGTSDDLKALSEEVHRRGMYLMVDIVANNVMSTSLTPDYSQYFFKDASLYHPYCPVDYSNLTSEEFCWLGDTVVPLPDVDTENPTVVSQYNSWISGLVQNYSIDGLRIDAAKHVKASFWPGFCSSAGVFCMGEVFDPSVSLVSSFQGSDALDSVLNYPLLYALQNAFTIPGPQNISALTDNLAQSKAGYKDTTVLGNFLENQDNPRWHNLSVDPQSLYNAMAFTFMTDGIPIVYYGQEQGFSGNADPYNREPLWPSNYTNTTTYQLMTTFNTLRNYLVNNSDWATQPTNVLTSNLHGIALQKGQVVTVLTNIGAPPQNFTNTAFQSPWPVNTVTIDVVSCRQFSVASQEYLEVEYTKGGVAVVLVEASLLRNTSLCGETLSALYPGAKIGPATAESAAAAVRWNWMEEISGGVGSRVCVLSCSTPPARTSLGAERLALSVGLLREDRTCFMDNPPSSSTNIHTIVKAQIVFLLSTLTEENFERNQIEIRSLSEQHGIDTYLHFIRRLIVHSQSRLSPSATPTAFELSNSLTFRLLVQESQRLARDPLLAVRFREGIDKGDGDVFRHFDLVRFSDRVGLRPLEKLVLCASIVASPTRKDLATQAANLIRVEFDNAILALCHNPCFDNSDLSSTQLAKFMANLLSDPPIDAPALDPAQRQALIAAAQSKYGKDAVQPILQRVLPSLSLAPGTSFVQALVQLGPEITSETELVRALLMRFNFSESNPPKDAFVVEIIQTLSRLASEGSTLCDVGALVRALSSFSASLNWASVIKSFDWPDRHGVDTATLKLLIAILVNSPRDAEPHAVAGFWTTWSNSLYQLRLLDALLSLPADTFNFVQLPGKRIVTVDDVSIASPTIKSLAANVQGHTWNSLELFEVLVRLADSDSLEIRNCVREMLDKAIKISAELVHMGLLQVPDLPWNEIRREYSRRLLGMFLAGHPNHQLVFMRIWQIEPTYLTDAFRDFYEENPLNITRILDVAQDLKILESLLEVRPFVFALDVAALASRREYLNLDKWLADNVTNHGAEFLHSVILFLDQKMESEKVARMSDPAVESRTMALSPNTIAIILRMLRNSASSMDEADKGYCVEIRNICLQIHPRLMSLIPGSDVEPGFTVVTYSTEIEAEVDGIYRQMYDEQTTIDDVIGMLQRHKESNNPRDHEIFACMLHFLFDEYKFFQSYYPARELAMTAYLFGSLIQHQLIDYIPLGVAIRYIIDALNCPPETNLFRFGVTALSRFESRLSEWQPLCSRLLRIPHLSEARPDLYASIQRALADAEDSNNTTDPRNVTAPEPAPVFTAIRPDPIPGDIQKPPEEISDRILFIINNLAPNNFETKLAEMKEAFDDHFARWFANYLVDQRIATEPNNHSLYLRFLDALDRQPLSKLVLQETFVKSAAMLNSERSMQSAADRNTLKNIGSFLGTITLARNRPIKHKNIAFKELLLEGYDSGRLLIAIPFVCKTLEPCAKSKVFKSPNPWLMGVIGLLTELYHYAELKLQLKFEIEFLCEALDIALDSVEASTILRSRPLADAGPPLPEYVGDISSLPIDDYTSTHVTNETQVIGLGSATTSDPSRAVGAHIESILGALSLHIQISQQLGTLSVNHAFKRAVTLAVDRAVREIIVPVVERSVTIAGISTRELVTKDFATELNEEKLRKAGHLMAQKLAGSLALVTCKEPLKSNMSTHIRQFLLDNGFNEVASDQVVALLVQENLEVACNAIEKAAMERAVSDVDEAFAASFEARRRHREARGGTSFWDPNAAPSSFAGTLPDPLRVKQNGLQPHQSVYEDFGLDPKRSNLIGSRPSSTTSFTPALYAPSPGPDVPQFFNHQEAMERFTVYTRDLEAVMAQLPMQSLAGLPANHDLRHLVRQILLLAGQSADRARTPLLMSQKIVQLLYKTQSQLGREVYVALLEQLCSAFEDVAKEAITWLLYAEDERKFNVPVTVTLLRSGLISIGLLDQQFAKVLYNDPRPSLLTYVAALVRECLSHDPPVASQNQFHFAIEAMGQLSRDGKANDEANRLLDDLRGVVRRSESQPRSIAPPLKPETEQLRERLYIWFQQWVNIFQRSPSPEKNFVPFITQLTKQGILKVEDVTSFFFRVCAEASVNSYVKCVANGDFDYAFQALDAMARLTVYLIKYHGDAAGVNNEQAKVHYLTKILSIFVLVLANMHEEQGPSFQQKPFFRFFSSLINDLMTLEAQFGPVYSHLLIAISDTFSSLQPTYFPGFAFSWMCLISHRSFMPKLLLSDNREGWSAFHKLLLSLFKFLSPFLKDANLQLPSKDLYRGALRLLLVLLHDFPEFLSEYYFSLCDVIPPRCIQLRNIILSAFPPTLILPDPHLRNVAFESIPEMGPIPPILSDFSAALKNGGLGIDLDNMLLHRGNPAFLPSLKSRLRLPGMPDNAPDGYNLSLINSLVMYTGVSSVAQTKARNGTLVFVASDPGVVLLQYLATNLDDEGKHHLLSAMVLHLRYPNAHTHWFSCLLLHLFAEVKDDRFREIMTKVLLERFIVHRPHPWGALVTFIELLRNSKYDFWSKDFVRIAPEVTMLLESVARSIFP
uniref:Not1-domain-containing protein n=1 Tax=Mycena chlorophos TaxID=658473 RepID=A0ABQ0LLX9_MYCCL|nr:Not1-domain-containing protein [Mycena chlorophos]